MKIEQAITKFCVAKGIEVTRERIDIHAGYLRKSGFEENEIISAIGELFGETEFFPDASKVLRKLKPDSKEMVLEAQTVADKILEANAQFSSYDQKNAREYVGELCWFVVERFGGWDCVTNLTYSEMGTARAQLRKIAESAVNAKQSNPKLDYTKQAKAQLEQRIENKLKALDFSEFTK